MKPNVLTIAGLDPSGGAGIAADLRTFAFFKVWGVAVVTSITYQNTMGISGINHLPPQVVLGQLEAIISDISINAVKLGMLGSEETISSISSFLQKQRLPHIVIDPVLKSSSGYPFLDESGIKLLKEKLLPLAEVVTPNLAESSTLSGVEVSTLDDMKKAARIIHGYGPKNVVITGGHLKQTAADLLYDGREHTQFDSPKIKTPPMHGIGCAYSSAIAAQLSRGVELKMAIEGAKDYILRSLQHPLRLGKGRRVLDHFIGPD